MCCGLFGWLVVGAGVRVLIVLYMLFWFGFSSGSCRLSGLVVGCGLDFVTWYCRILAAAWLWRLR